MILILVTIIAYPFTLILAYASGICLYGLYYYEYLLGLKIVGYIICLPIIFALGIVPYNIFFISLIIP